MNEGEKAIYAAALVRSYNESHDICAGRYEMNEEKEREIMHGAAEWASGVVATFRDIVPELKDGFGGGSDVYKMALAMTRRRK
jgi:hypothetical protein